MSGDILKETWKARETSPENVVTFVQWIQDRLEQVHSLAKDHEGMTEEQKPEHLP